MKTRRAFLSTLAVGAGVHRGRGATQFVRSVRGGLWLSPATWEGERIPTAGDKVQIAAGHRVV
ncbi:MAG: hypothetical protein JWP63_6996, partial [Candidatus Solibacter sp.]|nr:hypothetical protein [Candidatus Solibacter sp.]